MSIIRRAAAHRVARLIVAGLACLLSAAGATTDPPVAGPLGGGQSVTLEPAPPRRIRAVIAPCSCARTAACRCLPTGRADPLARRAAS